MNQETKTMVQKTSPVQWVFLVLVVLSVGGVAIMDFKPEWGLWYWSAMAIVYAGASIGLAWQKAAADNNESASRFLRRQFLHWGVLILTLALLGLHRRAGVDLLPNSSGLIGLLLLSLATMLAGVHFEWRMLILGLILAAAFLIVSLVEKFFWVILIVAIIAYVIILFTRKRSEPL